MAAASRRTVWRRILWGVLATVVLCFVVLVASTEWFAAFGGSAEGEALTRIERSPNFRDGRFQNPVEARMMAPGSMWKMLGRQFFGDEIRVPPGPLPIVGLSSADYATPPYSGLRATWLGHSTVLVEIDGHRVLFDPMWSGRASPSQLAGPRRFHPPPLPIEEIPPLDAVIVSHDHYDHLDMGTIRALAAQPALRFVVPLGMGAHLERWGINRSRITELDWREATSVGGLTITATPSRHFSGRWLTGGNRVLWATWVVAGPSHRVFHSGDTGFFEGFARIGADFGPFDLTMIKIGAYDVTWPDIHVNPEEAVRAHTMLRGAVLLPIHWGTFNMAFHDWFEPAERVLAAASQAGIRFVMPRQGQQIEPSQAAGFEPWWRSVRRP